ncbi:MAG: host attachment protein [Verrucomicrobiota bacterium]
MQTVPHVIIVADRGEIKFYHLDHISSIRPALRLMDSLIIPESHQKYEDRFTDQAGHFSNPSSTGAGSTGERLPLKNETQARIFRQLGGQINQWLRSNHSPAWSFAASAEISSSILDEVSPDLRRHLHLTVHKDLVKKPVSKLLEFFIEEPIPAF